MRRAFGEGISAELADPHTPRSIVLDNYYRTFWYSQGSPELEDKFAELLVAQYRRRWSVGELAVGQLKPEDLKVLRLPAGHGDPDPFRKESGAKGVRAEFVERWDRLAAKLQAPARTSASITELLKATRSKMIEQDDYYTGSLSGGYRYLSTCDDPCESMYRTFVLGGRDAGTPEFNRIFAALRQEFIESGPSPEYYGLVSAWEEVHAYDEYFCPPDDPVIQAVHESGVGRRQARALPRSTGIIIGAIAVDLAQ